MNVLEAAQDLVDKRLEMCIGERLTRSNDSRQIALHELCALSALFSRAWCGAGRTFVEIALVEVVRARNVHVVEASYLR